MNTTKKEILNYVDTITKKFSVSKLEKYSASFVAGELSLSRSIVSSYLNELYNEGLLIKIVNRPVLFIHKGTFERLFDISEVNNIFDELEEFVSFYEDMNLSFTSLIGKEGSLFNIVESIKNTINYPGVGLPMIIEGKTGTGKTYLSHLISKYVIAKNISDSDTVHRFRANIILSNPSEFLSRISNNSKLVSLIFISGIDELDLLQQEDLIWNLSNVTLNDNKVNLLQSKQFRLIFIGGEKSKLSQSLEISIPIVLTLPSYNDRSNDEKFKLISKFLHDESKRLNCEMLVSESLIELLQKFPFQDNIRGLQNEILKICSKAYSESSISPLELKLYHVSSELLSNFQISEVLDYDNLITLEELLADSSRINDLVDYSELNKVIKLLLDESNNGNKSHYDFTYFITSLSEGISDIGKNKVMHKAYINIIDSAADIIEKRYFVIVPSILRKILAGILYAQLDERKEYKIPNEEYKHNVDVLYKENYLETTINNSFQTLIELNLGIEVNELFSVMSIVGIIGFNKAIQNRNNISSIILCHGDSTASSMADAANKLLGEYIFDAINMPISTPVESVIYLLKERLEKQQHVESFIFLVDMGSLEKVNEFLTEFGNISIIIVSSVSTNIALHVGSMISANKDINYIYEKISKEKYVQSKLIVNEQKEEIILFMGYEKSSIANYSYDLFRKSLPRPIDLKLMVTAYNDNIQKTLSYIEEKGIVKHIIGVMDAEMREVDYVDLTDLVALEKHSKLYNTINEYLSVEEIEIFKNNLIRNFSIENVVEHLTILNPTILIEEIELSLQNMEDSFGSNLGSKIKLGLYAHISVAVERLVTNNQIDEGKSTKEFEVKGKEFIIEFKKSFRNIEKRYNVVFPTSEILYIFDFFKEDKGDI